MSACPLSELPERISELAGTMPIECIARELHIGRRTLFRIASEHGIELQQRRRDWRSCKDPKESARAVFKCDRDLWEHFMLFGPVRHYAGWQRPVSVAYLHGIVRDR